MKYDALKPGMVFIIMLSMTAHSLFGQQQIAADEYSFSELVAQSFGHDQNLVNGAQFYNRYGHCQGVPYFMSIGFVNGDITIQDKLYKDVDIRYDLLAQQIEIEFENVHGGSSWLVSVADHVNGFRFGNYQFAKLDLDGSEKFYQVIPTEMFTCYILWSRKLTPVQSDHNFTHTFSDLISHSYLELNGKITPYKNRKAFVDLLPTEHQKEVKRFLKRNFFRVQQASPDEMVLSMNAVSNLIRQGGSQ